MRKTFLLLFSTLIITAVLCFSGANLLALVAQSDTLPQSTDIGAGSEEGGNTDAAQTGSDIDIGVPGFSFFTPLKGQSADRFVDVLRDFRQDAGEPINIVVLASDASSGNTDAIMVVHYDPKTAQINLLSVPRDTYVKVNGYKIHRVNGLYKQKNGGDLVKDVISGMLGQEIDYYVHVNLKTIREIVDLLDGVEYDVPLDLVYDAPDQDLHINIKKGLRTLTGKQVEGFLRFRTPNKWTDELRKYTGGGSDLKSIERQHDFFNMFLKQKLTLRYLPKINDIINNIYSNIDTDLTLAEILKLVKALPGLSPEKFQTATLPGDVGTIGGGDYYIHS
jgi:LCP family protein required for cell wall assembly